ncbi:MAG: ABC transporter permease [Acidimicrobiia bacterium]
MGAYVVRRLLAIIPLLLIISFIVFALSLLIPGDPARTLAGGQKATAAGVARARKKLHLDQPFVNQYGIWLGDAVQGDLGESFFNNRTVGSEIASRFPVTLSVAVGALAVTVLLGVPLGILAGTRPGSVADRIVTVSSSIGLAMPDFWLAMILLTIFAVNLHMLPSGGYVGIASSPVEWATHLYLPWIAIGIPGAAGIARQMRGAMIDALEQDYIRTAAAKGLRSRVIVFKHALKNASLAPVTVLGITFAYMLGGTVIIENIFSLPGMGSYFYDALINKDLPVIQGVVLLTALIFVALNLVVDLLYAYLNPKVRLR